VITSSDTFGADRADGDEDPADPLALLIGWLPANDAELRPLMTLSTIGLDGYPAARNVLVSRIDADGIYIHTDSRSGKAAELAAVPRACGTLVWPEIGRQVVVVGDVAPTSPTEAHAAFAARSRYLQLLAWANTAELAAEPLAQRRAVWQAFAAAHPDGTLSPPPTWCGFRLRPHRITFWRGDAEGPSNRAEYRVAASGWMVARLPG
jgi:pyridoxamine 5'-phosphate oxidase